MSVAAICVALLAVLPCWQASGQDAQIPTNVGARRQLFVDRAFFERSANIALRMHPGLKTGVKVLQADKPWESATLNWFSVLKDRGVVDRRARYRMWYECYDIEGWPTADDTSFCYAESRDGVRWTKPELGLFEYQGSKKNNILFRQVGTGPSRSRVHGCGVWIDPTAPPQARYKAVSQGIWQGMTPPHRVAGMVSPDGIRWTRMPNPICDIFADSQYAGFWDADLAKYVLYGRVAGNIGRAESADFSRFPPLGLVLVADTSDPPNSNLYNSAVAKYPRGAGAYLALPSLYQRDPKADTLDIRLAVSRDGVHWTYPEQSKPFIALGATGEWDSGSLYVGQGIVEVGDETWLYYSGSPLRHQEAELENLVRCSQPRAYSRVVVRRDRFVSADAGADGGWFVTPPLRFEGDRLRLNVNARKGGMVCVALLDANGDPLPGRGIADCAPVTGDHLDAVVRWRGGSGVGSRAGRPTRLRVELRDAALFGFRFGGP